MKAISFSGLELLFQCGERGDFFFGDVASVFGAEKVFEQDAERERQMLRRDALLVERVEAVDFVFFVSDFESGAAIETIHGHDGLSCGRCYQTYSLILRDGACPEAVRDNNANGTKPHLSRKRGMGDAGSMAMAKAREKWGTRPGLGGTHKKQVPHRRFAPIRNDIVFLILRVAEGRGR